MKTQISAKLSNENRYRLYIRILFILSILGLLSISASIFLTRKAPANKIAKETYIDISDDWSLDPLGENPVSMKNLGKNIDEKIGVLSIYYRLPELTQDTELVYRSKDVYTKVLIDGQIIYETSVYESEWYNDSPGNIWNVLDINSKYSGKCLELQVEMVYDTRAVTVDSLMLGDKAEIILDLFFKNIFGILISLMLMSIGIALVILDCLPSYGQQRSKHSLLWIGLFTLLTGIWCLIETNMLQFFVKDMRKLQLIDNMIIIVDSMPLLIYMDCEHEIFKLLRMRILYYVNICYTLLCVFLQITHLSDLHNMLDGGLLIMIITDVCLLIFVLRKLIDSIKTKQNLLYSILQVVGMSSLWILVFFETARTHNADRIDRAGLVRIGMLVLCSCWSISSQIEKYRLVVQGLKFDFVRKLAYEDGLTGIANRTAYMDKLEEYEQKTAASNISKIGIIYFDVNYLKRVNDVQGHEMGDKLIKTAAEIIENSFGLYGKTYRIGGDEFAVLMEGKNLQDDYDKGLELFNKIISEKNNSGKYTFDIHIANGFAICEELTREKIDYAISIADSRMYENKIRMKTNM